MTDRGDRGVQGERGVKGDHGQTGDTGLTGADGRTARGERGPSGDPGERGQTGPAGLDGRTPLWLLRGIALAVTGLIVLGGVQIKRVNDFATANCERGNTSRTELNTLSRVVAGNMRSDIQVREEFKRGSAPSQRRALRGAIKRTKKSARKIDQLPLTNCSKEP